MSGQVLEREKDLGDKRLYMMRGSTSTGKTAGASAVATPTGGRSLKETRHHRFKLKVTEPTEGGRGRRMY